MSFLHRKIHCRDEFSIWAFAQVYYSEYHVQNQNNSRIFLRGIALDTRVETKISHYDIIVGKIRKEQNVLMLTFKGRIRATLNMSFYLYTENTSLNLFSLWSPLNF